MLSIKICIMDLASDADFLTNTAKDQVITLDQPFIKNWLRYSLDYPALSTSRLTNPKISSQDKRLRLNRKFYCLRAIVEGTPMARGPRTYRKGTTPNKWLKKLAYLRILYSRSAVLALRVYATRLIIPVCLLCFRRFVISIT